MADNTFKIQPEQAIEQKVQSQREYKRVGQVRLKKGLSLFYYDVVTGEVGKVEITKKVSVGMNKKAIHQKQAQHNENHIYTQALNMKNAVKKFKKIVDKAKKINDARGSRGK